MSGRALHGTLAEFRDADGLCRAVAALREAGFSAIDAYSPFPLPDLAASLGWHTRLLPWIAAGAGAIGALIQYGSQWWMNAVDYPLNVGGRPLHAWPTFIPSTIVVAILWAGVATLVATLAILRLPRLDHPLFAVPGFRRASQDRFFLLVRADDPAFAADEVAALLWRLGPARVTEVPA